MTYTNIVGNNSPSAHGVIYVSANYNMSNCIFYMNENTLFLVSSGSLHLSDCFISHSGQFSAGNSVTTSNNNSFGIVPTYQIQFFQTQFCPADFPLPEQSPASTISQDTLIESNNNNTGITLIILFIVIILCCSLYGVYMLKLKNPDGNESPSEDHDEKSNKI